MMMNVNASRISTVILALFVFAGLSPARAQQTQDQIRSQRGQTIEEQRRKALHETTLPPAQKHTIMWDYGAWWTSAWFTFDDTDTAGNGKDRTFRNNDLRAWINLNIGEPHQLYARVRTAYVDYNKGDSFNGNDDDLEGPNLDQAFYRLNLVHLLSEGVGVVGDYGAALGRLAEGDPGKKKRATQKTKEELAAEEAEREQRAAEAGMGGTGRTRFEAKAGRFYQSLGVGFAYSRVNDGVTVEYENPVGLFQGFYSRTVRTNDDFDQSVSSQSVNADRSFYGGAATALFTGEQRPFVYFFRQSDFNDYFDVRFPTSSYDYESKYLGTGSSGEIVTNLRYQGELVYEFGEGHADPQQGSPAPREGLRGNGMLLGAEYYLDNVFNPRLALQYLRGSGDSDRASVTNTVGGNTPTTHDHNFIGFGFAETGLALGPLLSNIRVIKTGLAFKPLKNSKRFSELELATNYYYFFKDERTGAISDFRAARKRWHVGDEVDVAANWKLLSDLTTSLQVGFFKQGAAYFRRETRAFLAANFTFSF